jgi:hypothetical protein
MGGMPMGGMPMPMPAPMPMDGMPMQNMQGMNQMQMFSPANYDPIMLQSIAPLQTRQAIAPPNGLMDPTSFAHSIASYSRQAGGGGLSGGAYPSISEFPEPLPGDIQIPTGNFFKLM